MRQNHLRRGADHWNEYIETYEGEVIDFDLGEFRKDILDLTGYHFPLPTSFDSCRFKGQVKIEDAHFESWVSFSHCSFEKSVVIKDTVFEGEVDFESVRCANALLIDECSFVYRAKFDDMDVLGRLHITHNKFNGDVDLSELGAYGGFILSDCILEGEVSFSGQFHKEALFLGNKFNGFTYFSLAHFKAPTILRGNIFKYRPSIDKIRLSYTPMMPSDDLHGGPSLVFSYHRLLKKIHKLCGPLANALAKFLFIAKAEDGYTGLRQFRLFAQEYDDRRLALEIYALEQKSRRLWYDAPLSSSFVLGVLFQVFSDFGRSIIRPAVSLFVTAVFFTGIYFLISSSSRCILLDRVRYSVFVSINNTVPFLSWSKQGLVSAAEGCLLLTNNIPLSYGFLSMLQTSVSLAFFFMVGLAIRNIFKMS